MPECVLQKTCVAYKNWHCGNFLQENCQPINNCGPAQETVPDCSYLFLFFEILYSRQHFLLEPDLKKFVWDIYIDRFFIPPNKMRAHFFAWLHFCSKAYSGYFLQFLKLAFTSACLSCGFYIYNSPKLEIFSFL